MKENSIIFKGKNNGIQIILDNKMSFNELKTAFENKIKSAKKGDCKLNLRIFDPEINRSVNLASGMRIELDRKLVEALDSIPDISYQVQTA